MSGIDYENDWKLIHPAAQPYYDRTTADRALVYVKERCAEWSYEQDAHGYCHFRSADVALIAEVERLREAIRAALAVVERFNSPDEFDDLCTAVLDALSPVAETFGGSGVAPRETTGERP